MHDESNMPQETERLLETAYQNMIDGRRYSAEQNILRARNSLDEHNLSPEEKSDLEREISIYGLLVSLEEKYISYAKELIDLRFVLAKAEKDLDQFVRSKYDPVIQDSKKIKTPNSICASGTIYGTIDPSGLVSEFERTILDYSRSNKPIRNIDVELEKMGMDMDRFYKIIR